MVDIFIPHARPFLRSQLAHARRQTVTLDRKVGARFLSPEGMALFILLALLLAACAPATTPTPTPAPMATLTPPTATPITPSPSPIPPSAVENIRQWLAQQLGLSLDGVIPQSIEAADWPDACLGVEFAQRACAEVITPGYKIILQAEGALYEVHTNQDGSRYYLAAAPPLEIENPLIIWSQERDGECVSLFMSRETAAHGLCGGVLLQSKFAAGTFTAEVDYFTQKYAPFEAQTPAGTVTFYGQGAITATPWEERALAEWARLLYEQAISGRTGAAWGLALDWQRRGGIAALCDEVTIYRSGVALVSSCKGDLAAQPVRIRLTSHQLQQIYSWVDEFEELEYEHTSPGTADAMTIRLLLAGTGKRQVDENELQAMNSLVADILAQALTQPDLQQIQSARQALLAYLDALKAGRYSEAVALYGGDYQGLRDMNPNLDPNDYSALFHNACTINGFVCHLKVRNFVWETQLGPSDFRFTLEFENPDGSLFSLGPCCGASPEEFPPQTQFDFWVKQDDGKFIVLTLPPYVP